MTSFIYLNHILNNKHLSKNFPITRICPLFLTNYLLKHNPYKITLLDGLKPQGTKEIKGIVINFSLFAHDIASLKEQAIIEKIDSSIELVRNRTSDIIGLGGVFSDFLFSTPRKLKFPATNGSYLTAWSIIETLYQTAQLKNINLEQSTLAISGALGAIGRLCCKKLSYHVQKIILYSNQKQEALALKDEIARLNKTEVVIDDNCHKFAKDADVMLFINNHMEENLILPDDFKKNAIVCVLFPDETTEILLKSRQDLSVINSGFIKLPFAIPFASRFAAGENIVPSSFAETMLLALDNKLPDKGLTNNQNIEKLEEIADMAARHGFEVFIPKN